MIETRINQSEFMHVRCLPFDSSNSRWYCWISSPPLSLGESKTKSFISFDRIFFSFSYPKQSDIVLLEFVLWFLVLPVDQVDQVMFDILLLENNYFDLRDYVLLTRKEEEDARSMSRKRSLNSLEICIPYFDTNQSRYTSTMNPYIYFENNSIHHSFVRKTFHRSVVSSMIMWDISLLFHTTLEDQVQEESFLMYWIELCH